MAELLRRWITQQVGVDVTGTLEKEFANGYKLGEVLHRCQLQPDFDKFVPNGKPDSLINNFTRLQPTLTNLGIKMNSNIANDIMTEKIGVAAKLIYAIKSVVEGLENNLSATRTTKLGHTLTTETKPSAALVEAQAYRSQKLKKNSGDLRSFEQSMRTRAAAPNKVMEAMHLRKFEDEMIRQTRSAREGDIAEQNEWLDSRDSFRGGQLEKMSGKRQAKSQQTQADYGKHSQLLAKQNATELEELRVEMTLHQRRTAKLQSIRAKETSEVINGIDAYENNLRRIGSAGAADDGDDPSKLPPIGPTPYEHIQRVRTMAPAPDAYTQKTEKYLSSLHTKKRDEAAARKEREARRRRVLVEQQREQAELEARAQVDMIVGTLQRESAEEARLAARLWQLQQEKAVMTENRALREQQYAERREADWRERLRREAELFRSQKEQYREEAELEMGLWRQREMAKADAKRRKHEVMCREIVWNVAGLAFRAAEYRETTGVSNVPRKEFRDWVAMFVAGDPALMEPLMKDDKLFHLPETANVVDNGNVADYLEWVGEWDAEKGVGFNEEVGRMVADLALVAVKPVEDEVEAIAEGEGERKPEDVAEAAVEGAKAEEAEDAKVDEEAAEKGSRPGSKGSKKGAAAAEEEAAQAKEDPEPEVDGLSRDYPIKLAVTGAPFSGKSTVAAAMAAQLGLKVISPEGMVAQVVGAARAVDEERARAMEEWKAACVEAQRLNNDPPPAPAPEDPASVTEMVAIGREIAILMDEGEELDDDTILRLVLLGVRNLGPAAPLPVAEPPDPSASEAGDKKSKKDKKKEEKKKEDGKKDGKKGGKGKKTEEVAEEPEAWMGYVLDGYPATKAQSVALERALTGLDLDAEEAWLAAASRIAPPPPEYTSNLHRALHSGLDHVVVLGLGEEETVVKRAVGRRVDPESGVIYHLEFDPPPADQPGHTDRLTPVEDAAYDAVQVQERLATHVAEAPALDQWLGRFVKLRCGVDASVPAAEVTAAALKIADSLLKAKSAAAAANAGNSAATEALAAAEAARSQVVEAQGAVREAARNLLDAKKAELKAAAELAEDPTAAELMKGEASAACAEHVLAGNEALRAVQAAADRAEEAATKAREAVEAAVRGIADTGLSAQAEITAKAAAEEATQAAEEAEAAKTAAREAAARAKEVFEDAVSRGEKADAMVAEEAAEAAAAAEGKGGKGGKGGKSGKAVPAKGKGAKGAKEEEELSPIEAVLTLPPEPEPEEEAEVAAKPEGLTPALGKLLHKQWEELEGNYLKGLSLLFASLREERTETVDHFVGVRKAFLEWLNRPDSRPAALAEFMTAFNAIAPDLRKRPEVMGELLLRADELRDALWDVCDSRLAENEAEQAAVVADSFLSDHTEITAAQIAALVQLELDRYTGTLGVIQAYACAKSHVPGARQPRAHITAPDVTSDHPPPGMEAYFNPKSTFAWPEWIAPLDDAAPKLAHALRVACASVHMVAQSDPMPGLPGGPGEEGGSLAGTPAAKASRKNVTKDDLVVDDTDYNMEDVAAARELAAKLMMRETELLQARLKLLAERGVGYVADLQTNVEHVHEQLQEWLRERYHSECSAVQSVHAHVRRAVEAGTPLPHDLRLEGEAFVVDESTLSSAIVPPPRPAPRVPGDNATAPPGVLSTTQLSSLGAALARASPSGGLLPLSLAVDVIRRVAATRLADGSPGMPAEWLDADFTATATALRLFDPSATGHLDWRQLLVSLVAAAFPSIPTAKVANLADAAAALAASDGDNDGHVTKDELLATKLWFDTDGMDMAAREAAANGGGYPRSDALKSLLWEAFSADTGGLVPWRAMLAHLCADHDLLAGLRKGFAALSGNPSEDAKLTGKQVAALAYPLGTEAGVPLGRSPMSASEVAETMGRVATARGSVDGRVSAEQLMYSLAGGKMVSELLSWLQLKDPFSALRR